MSEITERVQEKPWIVTLTCCGRDAGVYRAATWEDAHAFRESWTSGPGVNPQGYSGGCGPGHQRSGVITKIGAEGEVASLAAKLAEAERWLQDAGRAYSLCHEHQPDMWEGDGTCVICEGASLAAKVRRLHDAGMPTDTDAAVGWIGRLIAKCERAEAAESRVHAQALAISEILTGAGVGSCTLTEGVASLAAKLQAAEKERHRLDNCAADILERGARLLREAEDREAVSTAALREIVALDAKRKFDSPHAERYVAIAEKALAALKSGETK